MSVFTIFCHGTGGTSHKGVHKAEIVNLFSSSIKGISGSHVEWARHQKEVARDWDETRVLHLKGKRNVVQADNITLEGVGSDGDPLGREFDFDRGWKTYHQSWWPSVLTSMTGWGVQTNVVNAVNIVLYKMYHQNPPSQINILGWSRGAVEGIRIARMLHDIGVTKHIPINIFAIDPVAGFMLNDNEACHVYENVKNLVSVISTGENRAVFAPMVEEKYLKIHSDKTNYLPLHMPGVHDTIAKYSNSAGKLAFNLCYRFLKSTGTQHLGPTDMFAMSDASCLHHYGLLLAKRGGQFGPHEKGIDLSKIEKGVPKAQGFKKYVVVGGTWSRMRYMDVGNYVSNKLAFFNVHHEAIFAKLCPRTYNCYFGSTTDHMRYDKNSPELLNEEITLLHKIGESGAKAQMSAITSQGSSLPISNNVRMRKGFLKDLALVD